MIFKIYFFLSSKKSKDADGATAGVTQCTSKCDPYSNDSYPNLIFWDVPGIGVKDFPSNIEEYGKKIDIEKYDIFLFISCTRFYEDDLKLVEECKRLEKPFFFIRTKIKFDLENEEDDDPEKYDEKKTLERIRQDCVVSLEGLLAGENDVYLIESKVRAGQNRLDLDRLVDGIVNVLPERRRECFILSLSNLTRDCLKKKAKQLKSKYIDYNYFKTE